MDIKDLLQYLVELGFDDHEIHFIDVDFDAYPDADLNVYLDDSERLCITTL